MKINITKEQYKDLITMSAIANSIVGILGDMTSGGTDYKKRSDKLEKVEEYLLQFANEFGFGELTQKHGDKNIFDDEKYEKLILPIIDDYEDFVLHDSLATKLAWRDFRREHSEIEMDEMEKKNGGYFGVPLYEYEKKYWDEFEKHEFERLEIVERKK